MRYLLIDRVLEIAAGERLLALKNVSLEADYLEQHFPDHPIFPGALQIEAMAQAGGCLIAHTLEQREQRQVIGVLTSSNARFLKAVHPGDQLRIEVDQLQLDAQLARLRASCKVDGEVVSRAELGYGLYEIGKDPAQAALAHHWQTVRKIWLREGRKL